jgi:lactate dehydrogenase-like 2-hydroxyacid dehydrogenase
LIDERAAGPWAAGRAGEYGWSIVDEAADQALQERTIAAAALDVFADEPQVPQALMDLPNTVLTPHMASSTQQGLQAMLEQTQRHLLEYFGLAELPA